MPEKTNKSCLLTVSLVVLVWNCKFELANAGVYQWKDENGVVHFSQHPPGAETTSADVRNIDINNGGRWSPRLVNDTWYCGNQVVPTYAGNDSVGQLQFIKVFQEEVEKNLKSSQEQLAQAQRDEVVGSSRSDWSQQVADRIEEDKCLLAWTEKQLRENASNIQSYQVEYQQLQNEYEKLSTYKDRHCPNNVGTLIGKAAQEWADCDAKVRPSMRTIEKRLKALGKAIP